MQSWFFWDCGDKIAEKNIKTLLKAEIIRNFAL
jgi:hypothetical protein